MSTTTTQKAAAGLGNWSDERLGASKGVRFLARKIFPDHWSFMLGEIALYSFIILLLSGTFLTFFYIPSAGHTTYEGMYAPLAGQQVSEAYASTVRLSFDIRGGLLMRQVHHWSALLFVIAMTVHMLRVFFTGAFRKPRELNWLIGCILLVLGIIEGFAGYSLPDDLLSGTGIRIASSIILAIPVVGSYLSFFLFGGEFPGEWLIPRLYTIHVLLLPAIFLALIGAHLVMLVIQKHTQYPGPGRTNKNVVGYPLYPVYVAEGRWLLLHRVRHHHPDVGPDHDQPHLGATAGTIRPLSQRGPNPTGTWVGSTASSGSPRASPSSRRSASPSRSTS